MSITVYRFRDSVAMSARVGNYVTAKDARRLARALIAAARSVEREPFTSSAVATTTLPGLGWESACDKAERDEQGRLRRPVSKRRKGARDG